MTAGCAFRSADPGTNATVIGIAESDRRHHRRDALAHARSRGAQVLSLTAADFPFPTLAPMLDAMRREVMLGRGFCLVKGLRIDDLSTPDMALVYWGIGRYMGQPLAQNAQGEVLGHVTDLGVDFQRDPDVRGYQTRLRLPFHDDNADLVGLMCLQPARSGGLWRLVSSTTLHNVVLDRRPDLMPLLAGTWYLDRRGETPRGKAPWYTGLFFEHHQGRLFCRYNRTYVESAQRLPEVPRLTPAQIEALDLMDDLCYDPSLHLEMELAPGDMQFVSNYTVLHSRSRYEDWPEPERRRYLLRLWLETGLIDTLPASWAERHEEWKGWQLDPRAPIFDLSMRRAALAH